MNFATKVPFQIPATTLPAFRAMAVCNQHLDHGPISIELDGSVILELADRLISDPGVHIEIGG